MRSLELWVSLFIACFPTFAQVTQDWPLKSLPFTMPTVGFGETNVVYLHAIYLLAKFRGVPS